MICILYLTCMFQHSQ